MDYLSSPSLGIGNISHGHLEFLWFAFPSRDRSVASQLKDPSCWNDVSSNSQFSCGQHLFPTLLSSCFLYVVSLAAQGDKWSVGKWFIHEFHMGIETLYWVLLVFISIFVYKPNINNINWVVFREYVFLSSEFSRLLRRSFGSLAPPLGSAPMQVTLCASSAGRPKDDVQTGGAAELRFEMQN